MKKTFEYDEALPALPLPTLEHTLARYLDSGRGESTDRWSFRGCVCLVRALVDDEKYARTKNLVEKFAKGTGRELHERLKNEIEERQERNWVRKNSSNIIEVLHSVRSARTVVG